MVFKDKSDDPTNPCSTLELAGFTGVYFEEITAEEYTALANKYTDPLPAKISDPTKVYRLDDVKEEFATVPYTKGDGKGDSKIVPDTIVHVWGDEANVSDSSKKHTVGPNSGVQIGAKYYKFALYDKPIRIQVEASHDIDIKSDTSVNIVAKENVVVESKNVVFDGPTKFELGELEDGITSQFKITKSYGQDAKNPEKGLKGCDKLVVEIYNNSETKAGEKLPQTITISDMAFLKGTPIEEWYVIATGEVLEEVSSLKKPEVAAKYNLNKDDIAKRIKRFDMGTDTFYNEGTVTLAPKEKKAIASCHIFDIIKFTAWAKNNNQGPWANA
jgi:hypothetical protein